VEDWFTSIGIRETLQWWGFLSLPYPAAAAGGGARSRLPRSIPRWHQNDARCGAPRPALRVEGFWDASSQFFWEKNIHDCFQNGWFIMENPNKMDDLGMPLFLETPTYC